MKKLLFSSLMLVMAVLTVSAEAIKLEVTPSLENLEHYTVGGTYPVTNATDGNYTTKFWSNAGQAPDQAVILALSEATEIGVIKLYFEQQDQPVSADIQISTDNTDWTTIASFTPTDIQTSGSDYIYTCDARGQQAQYVRLYLTGTTNSWLRLVEFEVYTVDAAKTATPEFNPGSTEFSIGTSEAITITSEEGATIYYTLDGTEPTAGSPLSIQHGETVSVPTDDWTVTTTIKAVAKAGEKELSDVATATYTVQSPYCQPKVDNNGTDANYVGQIVTLTTTGAQTNANWMNPNDGSKYNGHVGVIGNTFTAEAGQTVTLNITSKNTNWGAIRVYVDLNGNFDLTDEGENIARVGTTSDNSDTKAVNQEFTIDAATPAGTYLMRVFYVARSTTGDVEFNITNPCGTYAQGGYYDFAFNVVESTVVTHTVTVEPAATEEGTVTYSLAEGTETTVDAEQNVSVTDGQTITLTAEAAAGYEFVKWIDGNGADLSTDNPYTYTPTGDVTISAVFTKEVYMVTLEPAATGEGTVEYAITDGEKTAVASEAAVQVTAGQTITLTATAATGYKFSKWVDGEGTELSTDNPYTYTPDADITISAVFARDEATGLSENVASRFSAIVAGNCIKISGVPAGEIINVYTVNSVLVASTVAAEGVNEIVVSAQGVLLVKAGSQVVKVMK